MSAPKVAMPVFEGRISPRLDCATRFLVLDGQGARSGEFLLRCRSPQEMAGRFQEMGVGVVICGGVSAVYERCLTETGLRLVTWVSGPVAAVIDAYGRGALDSGQCCTARRKRAGRGGSTPGSI